MITAFIITDNDAKAITRTLNSLIAATVEGLVREVVLLTHNSNETAAKIADQSGCLFGALDEFATLIAAAKGDWLLVLESGALPEQGWIEVVESHIQSQNSAAQFTRSPLAKRSFTERLFQREKPLALGLLILKQTAMAINKNTFLTPDYLAAATKPKLLIAALRPASNAHPSAA